MFYDCVCQMQTATPFATGHQGHMAYLMVTVLRDSLSPKVDLSHSGGWYPEIVRDNSGLNTSLFFCPASISSFVLRPGHQVMPPGNRQSFTGFTFCMATRDRDRAL